jgi:4-diphosphocytidyl-2-C-methyl-D-erythritol kinase
MKLFSPAKINLFLRVLKKRADGYHELASLFQTVSLGDTLTCALSKEDHFTCSDPTLVIPSNLVLRAVELFRRKTGFRFSVAIHLDKEIPLQAGLGGGSSNAATTLWALNALQGFPYSEQELQSWSIELGSDVPFFFSHGTAYCTGRGEKVKTLPPLSLPPLTLIKPTGGLSTPAVYQNLRLEECSSEDPEDLLADFYGGDPRYINDLEAPAFRLCPALAKIKARYHPIAFMAGSGSALIHVGQGSLEPICRQPLGWY